MYTSGHRTNDSRIWKAYNSILELYSTFFPERATAPQVLHKLNILTTTKTSRVMSKNFNSSAVSAHALVSTIVVLLLWQTSKRHGRAAIHLARRGLQKMHANKSKAIVIFAAPHALHPEAPSGAA